MTRSCFLTAGVVVLTIVINSTSMTWVLQLLGLDKLPPAKQASLDKARYSVTQRMRNEMPQLQNSEFLRRADWMALYKLLDQPKPMVNLPKKAEQAKISDEDLRVAFYRRLLETERQFYWTQYNQGALTGPATAPIG